MKHDEITPPAGLEAQRRNGSAVSTPRVSFYTQYGKRAFDLLLAILLLPILLPVMMVIALGMAHKGSVIFGHRRIGRGGKEFTCYKFRSMTTDADRRLAELLATDPEARAEWELNHKLKNDPRITRLGRLLRRTSLDELPQIWNVIRGEMSFVGPRPVTRDELVKYDRYVEAYLSVRPGVTGIWQISGRSEVSYAARVAQDANYVADINLARDTGLIALTALVPFKMSGR